MTAKNVHKKFMYPTSHRGFLMKQAVLMEGINKEKSTLDFYKTMQLGFVRVITK